MTQSLNIIEPHWQAVGPDMLLTGYLPASGGLEALDATLSGQPPLSAISPAHSQNGNSPAGSAAEPPLSRVEARRRSASDANKVRHECWQLMVVQHIRCEVCSPTILCLIVTNSHDLDILQQL